MFIAEIELDTRSISTNYIGCYGDDYTREFSKVFDSNSMTIEFCSIYCLSSGENFLGIQNNKALTSHNENRGKRSNYDNIENYWNYIKN